MLFSAKNFVMPKFFTFVMTTGSGAKIHGACLIFYERLSVEELCRIEKLNGIGDTEISMNKINNNVITSDKKKKALQFEIFAPKCIGMLNRRPIYKAMRVLLTQLLRLSLSRPQFPLECYISDILTTLTPHPQQAISLDWVPEIRFYGQHPDALPLEEVTFNTLFQCLSPENVTTLLELMLLETKILLISTRRSLLAAVAESLRALIFPFDWQCVYIPVCPMKMVNFISAPLPFVIGLDPRLSNF